MAVTLLASLACWATAQGAVPSIIFIGNTGAGKSTLLNIVAGEALFESGISIGKGLTATLTAKEAGGMRLVDIPGLADISRRESAARDITKALRGPGPKKVFFVLTTEAGRVREEDQVTMRLVLDAVGGSSEYGIILNKVDEVLHATLSSPESLATTRKSLMHIIVPSMSTNRILVLPEDPSLKGKKHTEVNFARARRRYDRLLDFITKADITVASGQAVKDIDGKSFIQMLEDYPAIQKEVAKLTEQAEKAERAKAEADARLKREADARAWAEIVNALLFGLLVVAIPGAGYWCKTWYDQAEARLAGERRRLQKIADDQKKQAQQLDQMRREIDAKPKTKKEGKKNDLVVHTMMGGSCVYSAVLGAAVGGPPGAAAGLLMGSAGAALISLLKLASDK